ncbi:hypothetical protein NUW46_19580 [Marinobacter sp. MA]|uniref:hypothetical protein n=1 Tax=Marinobacter sp. MA TaxID=2971606 RepID=UPI003AAFCA7B
MGGSSTGVHLVTFYKPYDVLELVRRIQKKKPETGSHDSVPDRKQPVQSALVDF